MDSLWLCTICANLVALALIAVSPRFISVLVCQGFSAFAGVMTYTLYFADWCSRSQYEAWWYCSGGVSWLLEAFVLARLLLCCRRAVPLFATSLIAVHIGLKLCLYFAVPPFCIPVDASDLELMRRCDYANLAVICGFVMLSYADEDATASQEKE